MKKKHYLVLLLICALVFSACGSAPEHDSGDWANSDSGYYWDTSQGESYLVINEGQTHYTDENQTVTFSLKVDTAAYSNIYRYIDSGSLPPTDAVRTEEMLNYFSYDETVPVTDGPFGIYTEIGPSPFDADKHIALIRVRTDELAKEEMAPCNLTFLIDVSGSMESYDKLPLLKSAFALLVETLDENDRVSIVTYASGTQVALDSARGDEKARILAVISDLTAGGSTAGASGIELAYQQAQKNYIDGGNNRVILATDGDFNVGISSTNQLEDFISKKRQSGVYLSVLGFGTGNIGDDIMETLSKAGNGNYSYIYDLDTAQKVLVEELGTTLFTVADDVKAQVDFKPDTVRSYRLIGYENRMLDNEDFEDDTKDAGEVGAGTDILMLFELELHRPSGDLFEVNIRYKNPGESESILVTHKVDSSRILSKNTTDFGFACSVAGFAHLLRGSEHTGKMTFEDVLQLAVENKGQDVGGYRTGYIDMLYKYSDIVNA